MENQNQLQSQADDSLIQERGQEFADETESDASSELRNLLLDVQKKLAYALDILSGKGARQISTPAFGEQSGEVIEGVFDGQHMVGQDGKRYIVPANYASKSKLVEGDILKLTITKSGAFIYKQIGPIQRTRITGALIRNENNEFIVKNEEAEWKILPASVTYFKGEAGDEAVILIPQDTPSKWAAVENIIKKT